MPTHNADVVVVGGGPGGTAAAIRCAGAGLSVTLVERAPFPRERPGETLHPGVEPLFEQLGVLEEVRAAGFLRHEGNWVDGFVRRSPALIAYYGYVKGACPGRDEAPSIVAREGGWTWTARVQENVYQWTCLSLAGSEGDRPSMGPPAELEALEPCGPARGADVTWRIASRPAGAGYFLVGDAAAVLDPASSHGVLKAMMTGMLAAHSIRMAAGGADERQVAESYCRWVREWFEHDAAHLKRLYAPLMPRKVFAPQTSSTNDITSTRRFSHVAPTSPNG